MTELGRCPRLAGRFLQDHPFDATVLAMKAPILVSLVLFLGSSHDLSVKHEDG